MRRHLFFPAALAAAALGPRDRLAAQAVERTDTPHHGALRVTFDPRIMAWERVETAAGRHPLGAALTGDSAGAGIPSIATLQQDLRAVTGIAGYLASLGHSLLAVRAERRVMPITLEYGVTNRLSIGVTVPIVRVQVRERLRLDTAGGNLGALPLLTTPADSARYTLFFDNFVDAMGRFGDSIQAGAYGCPTSPSCLRARALQAQADALLQVLVRAVYGTRDAPALVLPLAGSAAGLAINSTVAAVQRALTDTFNIAGFSQGTFLLPTTPISGPALTDLLVDPAVGFGLPPFFDTPRRLRFFSGDVEVAAKYRLFVRPAYAAAATVVLRLPTGHQDSPRDPFDLATGDHQTDVEGRLTQELTLWNRLWLNLSVRAGRQLAGQRERRLGPWDQPFLPLAALGRFGWDPGDYVAVDFAPLYRFSRSFAAGVTAGYYTQGRDRYSFLSESDSTALVIALGGPVRAGVLDAGTAQRYARFGVAVTYAGPRLEGGFSVEQTVSGAGGPVPVATVFRVVLRQSIQLF